MSGSGVSVRRVVVCLLVWVGLVLAGCSGKSESPPVSSSEAPPAGPVNPPVEITVTPITDLDGLLKPEQDVHLVAAARLEPDGTCFPAGVQVVWPLPQSRPAGTRLYVAVLDERERCWRDTGCTAVVDGSGLSAAGTVYHFSVNALTDVPPTALVPSGKPVPLDPSGRFSTQEYTEPRPRLYVRTHKLSVVSKTSKADTLKVYQSLKLAPEADMTLDQFKKLVAGTDYASLKALIEDGSISMKHNWQLGDWRIHLLVESIRDFCRKNPGTKIYRSDTGNQKNAYLSDVDQTVFAYRYEDGKWVRWAEGDVALKEHVAKYLEAQGVPMEKMEVETMLGRDRFIDERLLGVGVQNSLPPELRGKDRGLVISFTNLALGRQPGAYFLAGTVKLQQQLRVKRQSETHLKGNILPDDRPITVQEVKDSIGRLNGQVCLEIGPADDNPRGEVGVREGTYDDAKRVLMDGMDPDLQRGWAYDASVDNLFKWNEKVKYALDPHKIPAIKYPLRAVNDGPGILRAIEEKRPPKIYEDLDDAGRKQFLRETYGADLDQPRNFRWGARDGSSLLDRWKLALDACAYLRNVSAVEKRPVTDADLEAAFKPLAEKMAGPGNEARWKEFLGQARLEYTMRCQEIMTHNIVATARERVLGWLTVDPNETARHEEMKKHVDEGEIRKALGMEGPDWDARWESVRGEIYGNYADTARAQLLFSFRYMSDDVKKVILAQVERNPKLSDADKAKVRELAAESSSWFFHYRRAKEFPKLYTHIIGAWTRFKMVQLLGNIHQWVLHDIGWLEGPAGKSRAEPLVRRMGLQEFDGKVTQFFRKYNKTAGFGARFIKNMVYDVGNIDGVVQVVRAYSESGGDPDALEEAMIRETLYAIPVVGQVYSLSQVETPWQAGQAGVLMACAMASGYGRAAMILFNIGEAGVAIYHSDYRAPLANAVADAVYRGWTGPSLYSFAQTPAQFTDDDQARLDQIASDLRMMKLTREDSGALAGLLYQQLVLQDRKERWKGFVAEQSRYQGGALTGTGAQLTRKVLTFPAADESLAEGHPVWAAGPMLAGVKPCILFTASKEGPVEFYLEPLNDEELARMHKLEAMVETLQQPMNQLDVAQELQRLKTRHEAVERAGRYLERARTNPELMHQIRVDSLWPFIAHDESHEMVNAEKYVTDWLTFRKESLKTVLEAAGVTVDAKTLEDARLQLKERLLADTTSSRERWEQFVKFKEGRERAVEQWYENARLRLSVEALMTAVQDGDHRFSDETVRTLGEAGVDTEFIGYLGIMGEAIANRHRPLSPPEVLITGTVLKGDPDAESEQDRQHRLWPSVRVVADQDIYLQPYSYAVYQLNHDAARSAVAARRFRGLPLDDEMIKSLNEYLERIPAPTGDQGTDVPAFLVYAFCKDVRMPDRVVQATAARLPDVKSYPIPDRSQSGWLLGGAALWTELEPVMPPGPVQIVLRRPKPGSDCTEIVLTSENLARLDEQNKDTFLLYNIYIAQSADGPWVKLRDVSYKPGTEIVQESDQVNNRWDRVATDKVIFEDEHVDVRMSDNNWPPKPPYFRVGEQWCTGYDEKDRGKETFSNVVGPRDGFITWRGAGATVDGKTPLYDADEVLLKWPGWTTTVHFGMGPKNQNFGFHNAELLIKDGDRVRHFWTPRREGKIRFGNTVWMRGDTVIIYYPVRGKRTTLEAQGTAEGLYASRTLTLVMDVPDEAVQERRRWIENAQQKYDQWFAGKKDYAVASQKRLADMQKNLDALTKKRAELAAAATPNPRDIGAVENDLFRLQRDVIRQKVDVQFFTEFELPYRQAELARKRCICEFDFAGADRQTKIMVEAMRKRSLILEAGYKEQEPVVAQIYKNGTGSLGAEAQVEECRQKARTVKAEFWIWIRNESEWLCNDAYLAGSAVSLKERYQLCIDAKKEEVKERRDEVSTFNAMQTIGELTMQYADKMVELTGSRSTAAALYKRGWQQVQDVRARRGDKTQKWEDLDRLPGWWPPGTAGQIWQPPPPKPKSPTDTGSQAKPEDDEQLPQPTDADGAPGKPDRK